MSPLVIVWIKQNKSGLGGRVDLKRGGQNQTNDQKNVRIKAIKELKHLLSVLILRTRKLKHNIYIEIKYNAQ